MITAKQAATKAKNYTSGNLDRLHTEIEHKASRGSNNLISTLTLCSSDIAKLRTLGYTVVLTCDDRPCASPYYNISW